MESCLAHASLFFSLKRRRRRRVKNEAHKHNSTRVLSFVHKKSFSAASLKKKSLSRQNERSKICLSTAVSFFFLLFVREKKCFSSDFLLFQLLFNKTVSRLNDDDDA